MYNDLLKGYSKKDYVYIIEGCLDTYVSHEPASNRLCAICGEYDWDICEGLVKDIKKAKDIEDLYRKSQKHNMKKHHQKILKLR